MRATRTLMLLLGTLALNAGNLDVGLLITRSGGRSLDGIAKESEFNAGFRLGVDLTPVGKGQARLAFTRHRQDQDDTIITPSGPRDGVSQSDASLGLELSFPHALEWGGALELRRDYLAFNGWALAGLQGLRSNYDRIWFKAFVANLPGPGRISPLVRAEIGFTPQHADSLSTSRETRLRALAPDFHLTLCFGARFRAF